MGSSLSDIPELQPQPELDRTLTVRFSRVDRERIESAARGLGVAPSQLIRAVVRRALAEAVGGDD